MSNVAGNTEINPYQPPEVIDRAVDPTASIEVSLPVNARLRRLATDQYLLRWHPKLLFFSSLLIIAVSTLGIHYSLRVGYGAFALTMIGMMLVSGVIYESLVWRTRKQIAAKTESLGLSQDQHITLSSEPTRLVLLSDQGSVHQWPYDHLRFYWTSKGVLVCPEPLMFFLLPKKLENTRAFTEVLKTRLAEQT